MEKRGLILVVGSTGSGKSSTLAAMINHRNQTQSGHILTIEDPIEFMYRHAKSIVNQREVGIDTRIVPQRARQRDARSARRDPDRRVPRPRDFRRGAPVRADRAPVPLDGPREQQLLRAQPRHQHVPARRARQPADGPFGQPEGDHLAAPRARRERRHRSRRSSSC